MQLLVLPRSEAGTNTNPIDTDDNFDINASHAILDSDNTGYCTSDRDRIANDADGNRHVDSDIYSDGNVLANINGNHDRHHDCDHNSDNDGYGNANGRADRNTADLADADTDALAGQCDRVRADMVPN